MTPRLVILTQYFPPETGAPQTRLFELAKGLQQLGWEIEVITALPNYPHGRIADAYRFKWRVRESLEGVWVTRFRLYASNSTRALPRIVSMLSFSLSALCALPRLWRFQPDYLLVESPPLTLGFTGWLLCLMSKPRFIFNISDIWPGTARDLGAIPDGRFFRFIERLESFLYRHAFACTGQSGEIVAHLRERGAKRAVLFRNGVDNSRFQGVASKAAVGKGVDYVPKLVYTGLIGVAQGIMNICQNVDFKSLGVEFHLYGAGAGQQQLIRFLTENPDRNIVYHGAVKSAVIPEVLGGYDAALVSLVRPIYGAVPSKIYEAMAAGLPVFFSGEGEGARIVEQHQVGWTNRSHDYKQLADNIRAFKMNTDQYEAYAEHCRQVARQHFARQTQIENLHEFLTRNLP